MTQDFKDAKSITANSAPDWQKFDPEAIKGEGLHLIFAKVEEVSTTSLAPEELEKAQKFVTEDSRKRFIAARVLLREALALRCGVSPDEIIFGVEAGGKPFLSSPKTDTQFSISHSGDYILLGVTDYPVGVDIQQYVNKRNLQHIADEKFAHEEAVHLRGLLHEEFEQEFFKLWARKEAIGKCEGRGLWPVIRSNDYSSCQDLPLPVKGYSAAVACNGLHNKISYWIYE